MLLGNDSLPTMTTYSTGAHQVMSSHVIDGYAGIIFTPWSIRKSPIYSPFPKRWSQISGSTERQLSKTEELPCSTTSMHPNRQCMSNQHIPSHGYSRNGELWLDVFM